MEYCAKLATATTAVERLATAAATSSGRVESGMGGIATTTTAAATKLADLGSDGNKRCCLVDLLGGTVEELRFRDGGKYGSVGNGSWVGDDWSAVERTPVDGGRCILIRGSDLLGVLCISTSVQWINIDCSLA